MTKKNFFLTDVMKNGDYISTGNFLNFGKSSEENIDYTGEYYHLHIYDLSKYDRRFAMLEHNVYNFQYWKNKDYNEELKKRIKNLKNLGFKFILTHPWESTENMRHQKQYDLYLKDLAYIQWAGDVNWFWFLMQKKYQKNSLKFNHFQKKYDFLYLNKQSRPHRKKLFDKLQSQNILENSLYSFLDNPYNIKLNPQYELPWVDPQNYPRYGRDQDIYEPQFNDCAFNLISETNDNDYEIFITEKLWKPIIARQVFVVHGNYHYLKRLQDMGFKTFNTVFDESYDNEQDSNKRIDCIVKLCKELRKMDTVKLYRETETIRQHNFNLFFNNTALAKSIKETLSVFFKFADGS
jgi:hypothetical protein